MICTVEVELNAAHPELPLNEASTFVGSPSAVFVKKVPRSVGNWKLTKVYVSFAYPDNSLVTAEAVATGGVWVATLSACDTSGRTLNGFQISADGIDENSNAVEGYVLGIGDLSVCNRDRTVAPGVTAYNLRYFDTAPTSPKKGDVAPNANGDQLYYNGSSWVPFANVANKADLVDGKVPSSQLPGYVDDVLEFASRSAFPATGESGKIYVAIDTNKTYRWSGTQYTEIANPDLDDAVTKNSSNGVKSSGIWSAIWGALAALPTGFTSLYDWVVDQLAGKVPTSRTVNSKALSSDVTISDTDIPYTGYGSAAYPTVKDGLDVVSQVVASLPSSSDILYADEYGSVKKSGQTVGDLMIDGHPVAKLQSYESKVPNNLVEFDSDGNLTESGIAKGDVALKGNIPYTLGTAITASAQLADRTNNYVAPQSGSDAIALTFPAATTGKARDFLVLVSPGSSYSGTISFTTPSGATIYGDGFGATIAAGESWLFSITEIAANTFYTRAQKMEVPS